MDPLDLLEAASQMEAGKGHCAISWTHEAAARTQRSTSRTQPPAKEGGKTGIVPESVRCGLGNLISRRSYKEGETGFSIKLKFEI